MCFEYVATVINSMLLAISLVRLLAFAAADEDFVTAAATFSLFASCARCFDTLLTSCTTISTPLHAAVVTTVLHDRWFCSRRSKR